jgi:hypothetical protein
VVGLGYVSRWRGAAAVRQIANIAVVLVFFCWPIVLLFLPTFGGSSIPGGSKCSRDEVLSALAPVGGEGTRPLRVLSPLFWGPELMFRGGVEVVAGPYFRNTSGMSDSHGVMSATEWESVPRTLVEREIDLVVVCRTEDWVPWVPADASGTLYHSLVNDEPPAWLVPVTPVEDSLNFRIFQVRKGSPNDEYSSGPP